ncbi:unnamed protein product [Calypogeia fissa]
MKYFTSEPLEGPGEALTSPNMGPQTGALAHLRAKSYAPLNLGLACASIGDKAALGPRGASGHSEWPLGHMSGPDGRGGAPKWPEHVLVSGAAIESTGAG